MVAKRRIDPLAQLAASVLARETEIPWALLRHTYLVMKWNPAALRHLASWAERHGIAVSVEGRTGAPDARVRFTVL